MVNICLNSRCFYTSSRIVGPAQFAMDREILYIRTHKLPFASRLCQNLEQLLLQSAYMHRRVSLSCHQTTDFQLAWSSPQIVVEVH